MEEAGLVYLDSRGNGKGERIQKISLMESMTKGRQRLSDITNTTNHIQRTARTLAGQENLNPGPLPQTKDCIAELLKENTALLRLLGERNKIIELNALELQKLRVSLQQLQQQNCQLAKANTLMLEELNLGKDRLKALQHELGCTVAALKTTKSELEEKKKLGQYAAVETTLKEAADTVETLPRQVGEKAACNPKRKRTSRIYSLGSASVVREEMATEKKMGSGGRRRSSGRASSARISLKSEPRAPKEEQQPFELKDNVLPTAPAPPPRDEAQSTRPDPAAGPSDSRSPFREVKVEDDRDFRSPPDPSKRDSSSSHPVSISRRPQRRSTVGVSYKEMSLRVKMRRS